MITRVRQQEPPSRPRAPTSTPPSPAPHAAPPAGVAGTAHISFLAHPQRQPGREPDAMHAHCRRQAANGQWQMDHADQLLRTPPSAATTSTRSRGSRCQVERDDRVQHGVLGVMGRYTGAPHSVPLGSAPAPACPAQDRYAGSGLRRPAARPRSSLAHRRGGALAPPFGGGPAGNADDVVGLVRLTATNGSTSALRSSPAVTDNQ